MRVVSINDYARLDRPSLAWLIPRYLPAPSLIVLLGEPKVGKSFFALQIANVIGSGGRLWGEQAKRGRVLYLQFDTSEMVWRERITTMREYGLGLSDNIFLVHPDDNPKWCDITDPAIQRWWRQAIEQTKPDVIIVDVYREIHRKDENDSTAGKVVGDTLMELVKGYATILLHHTPKIDLSAVDPDEVRPVNLARGSSYLAGKADALWLLSQHRLWIAPRFGESFHTEARLNTPGLWSFPALEEGEVLATTVHEHPDSTLASLWANRPRAELSLVALAAQVRRLRCSRATPAAVS